MILISERQLQKKFKHAADFGISGDYNLQTATAFAANIKAHVQQVRVQVISGTYRTQPVTHHFDLKTNLDVIVDKTDNYISGWRLNSFQVQAVITTGKLGVDR